MLLLSLDTCDVRGSIALLSEDRTLGEVRHFANEEYSSWLLPAVDKLLSTNGVSHSDLAGYAAASGPGSFTGVRVGLTTAKAWAEVYSKPITPVSRLAVLAASAPTDSEIVATFIDAQRSQLFAAIYRRTNGDWETLLEESVISPDDFFEAVLAAATGARLAWVSLDPQILTGSPFWPSRQIQQPPVITVNPPLAAALGNLALQDANFPVVDALALDANYVRRSDAEIFGKKAVNK